VSTEHLASLDCDLDVQGVRSLGAWRGEVGAVVGEHGVYLIRRGVDQAAEELGCNAPCGLFVKLGKGELADAVNGHQHVELALFGAHFCDVDVEIANRVGLESLSRPLSFDAWQSADVMFRERPT